MISVLACFSCGEKVKSVSSRVMVGYVGRGAAVFKLRSTASYTLDDQNIIKSY